jgi:hypothetical protein
MKTIIFSKKSKSILAMVTLGFTMACSANGKVDQSEADNNLLIGLIAGQTNALQFVTDYNGNWNIGYSYDTNGVLTGEPTGRWILSTNQDGSGTIISGNNTNANYFGGGDLAYRILSYDRQTRRLYYQNTPGGNNFSNSTFGRIDFTEVKTTNCEKNAKKCFYFCEAVYGKASLEIVLTDTTVSNSAQPTAANACGSSKFSRALYREDNSTWLN